MSDYFFSLPRLSKIIFKMIYTQFQKYFHPIVVSVFPYFMLTTVPGVKYIYNCIRLVQGLYNLENWIHKKIPGFYISHILLQIQEPNLTV